MQPVEDDGHDVLRFKPNAIVRHLLDHGGMDLNKLSELGFSASDWEQFSQLLGYSVSGFSELSYVRDETWEAVNAAAEVVERRMASEQEEDAKERVDSQPPYGPPAPGW